MGPMTRLSSRFWEPEVRAMSVVCIIYISLINITLQNAYCYCIYVYCTPENSIYKGTRPVVHSRNTNAKRTIRSIFVVLFFFVFMDFCKFLSHFIQVVVLESANVL